MNKIAAQAEGDPFEVRVRGLLGAVEWRNGVDSDWLPFFARLSGELMRERLHLYVKAEHGMLVLAPPLVISEEDLNESLERVAECVARAWAEKERE